MFTDEQFTEIKNRRVARETDGHDIDALISEVEFRRAVDDDLRREFIEYIEAIRVYVQKYKVGRSGQNLIEILLEDAEAMRERIRKLQDMKDPLFVMGFEKSDDQE